MKIKIKSYRKLDQRDIQLELLTNEDHDFKFKCLALGMWVQARSIGAERLGIGRYYPELSDYRTRIWFTYFDEYYSRRSGWLEIYTSRQSIFADRLPRKVIREIWFAGSLGIFNDIQIWRREDELGLKDAIALGICESNRDAEFLEWPDGSDLLMRFGLNQKSIFLISRWGTQLRERTDVEDEIFERHCKEKSELPPSMRLKWTMKELQLRYPNIDMELVGREDVEHCGEETYLIKFGNWRYYGCNVCGDLDEIKVPT